MIETKTAVPTITGSEPTFDEARAFRKAVHEHPAAFDSFWGWRALAVAHERGCRAIATAVFVSLFLGALAIAIGLACLGHGAEQLAQLLRIILR